MRVERMTFDDRAVDTTVTAPHLEFRTLIVLFIYFFKDIDNLFFFLRLIVIKNMAFRRTVR